MQTPGNGTANMAAKLPLPPSEFATSPRPGTVNNAAKIPLPPSEFATSPRAPSLRVDSQSPKPRSQLGGAMSPKPFDHPMVRFVFSISW